MHLPLTYPPTHLPALSPQRKGLALEDVFAALDADLDGCLTTGVVCCPSGRAPQCTPASELGRLFTCVIECALRVCVRPLLMCARRLGWIAQYQKM